MLEWHFVLHSLPLDTPYAGGCYHGKLTFPERYPLAPPSLFMITPNGRLQINHRLCLSMTDFHPESWNPAWSVESLLVGVISFMIDERDPSSFGALCEPSEVRRKLAAASLAFNRTDPEFRELFPAFLEGPPPALPAAAAAIPAVCTSPAAASASAGEQEAEEEAPPEASAPLGEGAAEASAARPLGAVRWHAGDPGSDLAVEDIEGLDDAAHAGAEEVHQAPLPRPSGRSSSSSQAGQGECWICREDAAHEPLIQPCACRGSMSGVHASCVEAWIAHHRGNATGDELPRCSVCGEPYTGTERRPGVCGFLRHLCSDFFRQALRSALLVGLLVAYWTAAQPDVVPSLPLRVVLFVFSGSFFAYKALVLVVSLPRGRPPPENCSRVLFTGDFRSLAVNVAETVAIVVIAVLWCVYGQLQYYYVLPLCVLAVLPLASMLVRQQGSRCSTHTFVLIITIIGSPLVVLVHFCRLLWTDPKRLTDPLDGLLHVTIPLASIPLCWFCTSNVPVIIIWGAHSLALLLGILEKSLVKKAPWKEGRAWWIFMQLAVLAAYVANLLHNFSEGFAEEASPVLVFVVSLLWLSLSCALSLMVNWGICLRQYRMWQQRNGRFSLSPGGSPSGSPAHVAGAPPQTIGAAFRGGEGEVGHELPDDPAGHRPAQPHFIQEV